MLHLNRPKEDSLHDVNGSAKVSILKSSNEAITIRQHLYQHLPHQPLFNLNLNLQARTGRTKFSTKRYFHKEQNESYHPERRGQYIRLPCWLITYHPIIAKMGLLVNVTTPRAINTKKNSWSTYSCKIKQLDGCPYKQSK